jgi:hypothetical protein
MSPADEREERGFVVVDRRASAGGAGAEAEPAATESPGAAPPGAGAGPAEPAPAVDFVVLVQSFFVTALFHLGLAPDPETGRPGAPNLTLARQNIEILALIREKTRGNLEEDETRVLDGLLYEARMRFVEATQASGS